jgi:hypothetical protein
MPEGWVESDHVVISPPPGCGSLVLPPDDWKMLGSLIGTRPSSATLLLTRQWEP